MQLYVRKIPVLIHWTFPIGGLFIAYFLGDVSWGTVIPLIIAYTMLILVHESGHAIAAVMSGCKVKAVLVTGTGGWCFADDPRSFSSRLVFYAGGIIAQFIVLFMSILYIVFFDGPEFKVINLFVFVFTVVNVFIIIVNVLPFEGTDGRKIWCLFKESCSRV